MKKKLFYAFIALLTIFNLSAFGTLIYRNYFTSGEIQEDGCSMVMCLKDSLNLSEKQVGRMKECNGCFQHNSMVLSVKLKECRTDLIRSIKSENVDSSKINKLLIKIDSLQSGLLREVVTNLLTHKEIMTNKQREKFFSMILNEFSTNKETECLNKKQK